MIFRGFDKAFSTENERQYESIGLFWDRMSALYGRENLIGLGYGWNKNTIRYAIGLKDGTKPVYPCPEPDAVYLETELPEDHICTVDGRTEELSRLYDGIYTDGPLSFETEEFFSDGRCRIRYQREKELHGLYTEKAAAARALIQSRHSYRGTYTLRPVPREDLEAIMEAGMDAPSGCNKQTVSAIAVTDPVRVKQILSLIDPPVAQTAPALIAVITERIIAYRDRCFSVQDYAAAIENMLLMIEAMDYASCWYEGHITDEDRIGDRIAQALGIQGNKEVVCLLPVGVPEKEIRPPQKKSYQERVHFDR